VKYEIPQAAAQTTKSSSNEVMWASANDADTKYIWPSKLGENVITESPS
jgi:hypothetical protein